LFESVDLKHALELVKKQNGQIIAFHGGPDSEIFTQSQLYKKISADTTGEEKYALFIGPEGGWSEKEISLFKEFHAGIYKLGETTLRAETAVIVACGLVLV
jgi:RsmE family RNA methyltransferase